VNHDPPTLFPEPQSLHYRNDILDLRNGLQLRGPVPAEVDPLWMEEASLSNRLLHNRGSPFLRFKHTDIPSTGKQSYVLEIKGGGITLSAGDRAGFHYGLHALNNLLCKYPEQAPHLTLSDYPAMKTRGLMIDISRCKVPRLDTLLEWIPVFGKLRLNQLQLYTEHTFTFPGHERVWEGASPMTPDDYKTLDEACTRHCIELVPSLNSFGHMERWLKHPAYRHLAEHPDPFTNQWGTHYPHGTTLKPNAESARFMGELYRHFLPCFSSGQVHIGCDETWELGKGCSAGMVNKYGPATVYLEHLKRLHHEVSAFSRVPQFWADGILNNPEAIPRLPQPCLPVIWGYEGNHPFERESALLQCEGLPFLVAPGTSSWLSLSGRWTNARENIHQAIQAGITHGAEGMLLTDWGDRGHHQFWLFSWPAIFSAAFESWSGKQPEENFITRNMAELLRWSGTNRTYPDLILQLAKIDRIFSRARHNWSPVYELLIADPQTMKDLRHAITGRELDTAARTLDHLEESHELTGLEGREIHLTIRLMRLAMKRGTGDTLQSEWEPVLREYRDLWLRRNRPGGLKESIDYFKNAISVN